MIKTILFDLNDVLVTHRIKDVDLDYLKELGITQSQFWDAAWTFFDDYYLGKIGLETFFMKALDKLGLSPSKLPAAISLHKKAISLVPGIVPILDIIKKNKLRTILVAGDGLDSVDFKLDLFDLRKYFTGVYGSCYYGLRKEEEAIYIKILSQENLNAEECLFIDDVNKNLLAAGKVGIKTIRFMNSSKLKRDLLKYGINMN